MNYTPKSQSYSKNIALLKRVFSFAHPYKSKLYLSVFLSVVLAAIAPLRPYLIQLTINHGIKNNTASYFIHTAGGFIIEVTIIQITLLLVETITRFIFTFSTASLGQSVVKDLRNNTYTKILNLNLTQFDATPIGTLTTRTINDIESVNEIFSDGLIPIIADMLSIVSILLYMFYTDWQITLICLIPFPLLIVATYFFKESVNKSFKVVRNSVANLNAFVQEHLSGISIIQAFVSEKREAAKFDDINKKHRDANIKAILAYSIFFPIVELVAAISIGLLVWWAAKQSLQTDLIHSEQTAGIITSFILCLNLLFRPLRVIADKFNVLQMGMIASERVFHVLDNEDVTTTVNENENIGRFSGSITFKDVCFGYSNHYDVLKGISFSVPAGKTAAIVGNTGSGKTTIVSLINKLYHVKKGKIEIDQIDINTIPISQLRRQIAVVLQDVFLFSGSIIDNITLRNTDITKNQVIHTTKLIGLHDFIMQLPGDYDYNVMERGATLSFGQRQLISFARALLFNPSILILDEATSSIDSESEIQIQNAIDNLIAGRTSIIIAHRLSTIQKADIIIVIDKGEIVELGNHEELILRKGAYYKLHETQFRKRVE